jgi:hypothetical protein
MPNEEYRPRETAEDLANRLGYLTHEFAVRADWPMLLLSEAHHRGAARRLQPDAPARRDATLFGEET